MTTGMAMMPAASGRPSQPHTASCSTNSGQLGSVRPTYPSDSVSSIIENIHVVQHLLGKSVYEDNFLSMRLLCSQHARIWGEGSMSQSPPPLFFYKVR